jgi:hypothetical protein
MTMSFRLIERERIPGLYSDQRVTQHPTLDAARKAGAVSTRDYLIEECPGWPRDLAGEPVEYRIV